MPTMSANQRKLRTRAIKKLIKTHGSAYKAALALEVTPQSFYERMERLGLPRNKLVIVGEPKHKGSKRKWLRELFQKEKTVGNIAKRLGVCPETVKRRATIVGLKPRANRGCEPSYIRTLTDRKIWLQDLLKKYGNPNKVALALNVTPAAIYQRCNNYGIPY